MPTIPITGGAGRGETWSRTAEAVADDYLPRRLFGHYVPSRRSAASCGISRHCGMRASFPHAAGYRRDAGADAMRWSDSLSQGQPAGIHRDQRNPHTSRCAGVGAYGCATRCAVAGTGAVSPPMGGQSSVHAIYSGAMTARREAVATAPSCGIRRSASQHRACDAVCIAAASARFSKLGRRAVAKPANARLDFPQFTKP